MGSLMTASQPIAEDGVGSHHAEAAKAKREKSQIEHASHSCCPTGSFCGAPGIKYRLGIPGANIRRA